MVCKERTRRRLRRWRTAAHQVRDVGRRAKRVTSSTEMLGDEADVVIGEGGLAVGVGDSCAHPQEPRGRSAWPGRGVVEKDGSQGRGGNFDCGSRPLGQTQCLRAP